MKNENVRQRVKLLCKKNETVFMHGEHCENASPIENRVHLRYRRPTMRLRNSCKFREILFKKLTRAKDS